MVICPNNYNKYANEIANGIGPRGKKRFYPQLKSADIDPKPCDHECPYPWSKLCARVLSKNGWCLWALTVPDNDWSMYGMEIAEASKALKALDVA